MQNIFGCEKDTMNGNDECQMNLNGTFILSLNKKSGGSYELRQQGHPSPLSALPWAIDIISSPKIDFAGSSYQGSIRSKEKWFRP